jgi:putative endonuclease
MESGRSWVRAPSFTRRPLREGFFHLAYFCYILESEGSGRLYIGQTNNVEDRVRRHIAGIVLSTRNRGPWKLLYFKEVADQSAAVLLERKLKRMKIRRRLEHGFLFRVRTSRRSREVVGSSPIIHPEALARGLFSFGPLLISRNLLIIRPQSCRGRNSIPLGI